MCQRVAPRPLALVNCAISQEQNGSCFLGMGCTCLPFTWPKGVKLQQGTGSAAASEPDVSQPCSLQHTAPLPDAAATPRPPTQAAPRSLGPVHRPLQRERAVPCPSWGPALEQQSSPQDCHQMEVTPA